MLLWIKRQLLTRKKTKTTQNHKKPQHKTEILALIFKVFFLLEGLRGNKAATQNFGNLVKAKSSVEWRKHLDLEMFGMILYFTE